MSKRRDALIAQIEQAFSTAQYPQGYKLTNCKWNCDECAEIAEAFEGKHWTSLRDIRFLRKHQEALHLLQPEAFRYYLPAFMLGYLRTRADSWGIPDKLEFILTPPETEGADAEDWLAKTGITKMDYFLGRVSGFTPQQKAAIKTYLELHFQLDPMTWSPDWQEERQRTLHFWSTFEG